jgi:hypothetical protein
MHKTLRGVLAADSGGGGSDLQNLTPETRDEAARLIADRLLILALGCSVADPATWRGIAEDAGCRVYEFDQPSGARGEYVPVDADTGVGILSVNTAYERIDVARAFVHELAHHALWIWRPVLLASRADGLRYEGDAGDIRHDIARRVETLVVG